MLKGIKSAREASRHLWVNLKGHWISMWYQRPFTFDLQSPLTWYSLIGKSCQMALKSMKVIYSSLLLKLNGGVHSCHYILPKQSIPLSGPLDKCWLFLSKQDYGRVTTICSWANTTVVYTRSSLKNSTHISYLSLQFRPSQIYVDVHICSTMNSPSAITLYILLTFTTCNRSPRPVDKQLG